jgi:O-antigen ligase
MLLSLTRFSLYFLLIFTPLAAGSVQGWAISVIHMVTLLALSAFLLEKSLKWNWKWIKTPLDIPILCLIVFCLISSFFSVQRYTSIWSFILLLNYIIIYYLIIQTFNTRERLRHLIGVIIIVAAFLSFFGIVKKFGANPFPWWNYDNGLNPDLAVSSSTFGNPNHFAGYLSMAIPLLLGLFFTGINGGKLFLSVLLTLLMTVALIFSISRGGWVSTAVGLAFMIAALLINQYLKSKTIVLIALVGLFFLAFIALSNRPVIQEMLTVKQASKDVSLQSRILVWHKTIDMIRDYPWLGTGPGTFSTMFTQYQPPGFTARFFRAHNDYLHFISETGIPLIIIMAWMIAALYLKGITKLADLSRLIRGTTLGAMSGITALLFFSIFDFNLHIPANAILFTTLAAIVVSPIPKASDQMTGQRSENRRQKAEIKIQRTEVG